jgi:phasin
MLRCNMTRTILPSEQASWWQPLKTTATQSLLQRTIQPGDHPMTVQEDFARQAQDMFAAAKDAKIPENIQHFAEESVTKTREAFHKFNATAKDNAKALEEMVLASTAGNKAIGEKVMANTVTNTEALFDAAQAMAKAKTLPEAAQIQAKFFQQQMTIAGTQTKELFELSTKVAKQAFETMNSAATKSFEQVKKAS